MEVTPLPAPQFDLFTTVHKHYSVAEWKTFATENPTTLQVRPHLSFNDWDYSVRSRCPVVIGHVKQDACYQNEIGTPH